MGLSLRLPSQYSDQVIQLFACVCTPRVPVLKTRSQFDGVIVYLVQAFLYRYSLCLHVVDESGKSKFKFLGTIK